MNEVFELVKDQLFKMEKDKSWFAGIAGAVAIAVPQWVFSDTWTFSHTVLIVLLLVVLVLDWITGRMLAERSEVVRKKTEIVIDSLIRDGLIFLVCGICYGIDFLIGTHSIIFTVFTTAFIYHNLSSFVANATVLGWEKNYPMWLFSFILKWLHDEVYAKMDKYFPERKDDQNE
ncbi:phage holin family protein [Enterococcus ureasiticus]|uniref:phage holin family protein n=1 Tax=Enterococcus ureasiticus TaxID=903984 RepID=UPI001A8DAE57|nr:phage holin family protein [Enterococcus ureasiticus]MBO0475179.1 phage holin family protein [Enterococcus ureasiticus]